MSYLGKESLFDFATESIGPSVADENSVDSSSIIEY